MEVQKPYMKYEERWKRHGIVKIISSFLLFLLTILLIFLPLFRVDFTKMDAETFATVAFAPSTLPKLNGSQTIDESFGFSFSIFDEAYAGGNPVLDGFPEDYASDESGSLSLPDQKFAASMAKTNSMTATVTIIMLALGAAGLVGMIGVSLYRIISPENYTIHMYDNIKWRRDSESGWSKRRTSKAAIAYSIFSFYLACAILGMFLPIITNGGMTASYTTSYFQIATGISGWIALVIIMALAAIGLEVYAKIIKSRIRTDILHEEYDTPPVMPMTPIAEAPFPELQAGQRQYLPQQQTARLAQPVQQPYAYPVYAQQPAAQPVPAEQKDGAGQPAGSVQYAPPQNAPYTPAPPAQQTARQNAGQTAGSKPENKQK